MLFSAPCWDGMGSCPPASLSKCCSNKIFLLCKNRTFYPYGDLPGALGPLSGKTCGIFLREDWLSHQLLPELTWLQHWQGPGRMPASVPGSDVQPGAMGWGLKGGYPCPEGRVLGKKLWWPLGIWGGGALSSDFWFLLCFHKQEEEELGSVSTCGYKCCLRDVSVVVTNIIYSPLTLGGFAIKIYEGTEVVQGHLKTYIIFIRHCFMTHQVLGHKHEKNSFKLKKNKKFLWQMLFIEWCLVKCPTFLSLYVLTSQCLLEFCSWPRKDRGCWVSGLGRTTARR